MTELDDKIKQLLNKQGLEQNEPDKPAKKPAASKKPAKKKSKKRPAKAKHTSAKRPSGAAAKKKKKAARPKARKRTNPKVPQVNNGIDPTLFAHRYVQYHCNATVAYLSIKPDVKENTAGTEGWKLLRTPEVQDVLWPLLEGVLEKESAQSEWVIRRWLEQAEASPLDYFSITETGGLGGLDLTNISMAQRRNLKSIKYKRSTRTDDNGETVTEDWTVTVVDQQKAVELMAKMLGMLQTTIDPETEDRIGDLLERGVKRIQKKMDTEAWKDMAIEGQFSEVG